MVVIVFTSFGCSNGKDEKAVSHKETMDFKFMDNLYENKLYMRHEFPLSARKYDNEIIKIHYEERMGKSYTYSIEKINNPSIRNVYTYKTYYTQADKDGFLTKGTIKSDYQDIFVKNTWRDVMNIINSDEIRVLENHENERWLGNKHYYVLETKLDSNNIFLVHQPDNLKNPILDEIIDKIKSLQ